MSIRPTPTVRARRLRYELRRLREARALTIEQVAQRAEGDFSTSTISRWETGDRRIKPTDLRRLLEIYEAEEQKRDVLVALAREARQRGWWQKYGTAVPSWFQFFVGLESECSLVKTYESELIPGLLQTQDYHRAFLRTAPVADDDAEIERKIKVRMERQERLTADTPLHLWAVINEAVIRRVVGGPEVTREQLRHVAAMAELPHINVQVLAFRSGAHPAMDGGFTMLCFPEASDPDVAYVENQAGGLYLEEEAEVGRYSLMHGHLVAKALDPDESRVMIARAAEEI
ncbi:helix-turn-helix domain-containing protein [Actinomadura oligospora]|uniref:helix-turn-helix domain-containing protein n=1 Tax=Actinomadura oligospora TaxID=111804 RepID=UPI00047D123F|nr:helix-turn-helix transcriptional regulator [Actinomadura oligospora]